MRKIWREVTRKNPEDFRTRLHRRYGVAGRGFTRLRPGYGGQAADVTDWRVVARRVGFRLASAAADALQLSSNLQQRGLTLPDLSE